ncbi:MAG: hypothetical protein U0V48_12170 [Anaerolineales bacterium]
MANKKPRKTEVPLSTRIMQVVFVIFSVMLILTMVLTAVAIPR